MSEKNKTLLLNGNAAIAAGNYDEFVAICADDTEWVFVGDRTLKGKEEVREWMKSTYNRPPKITVDHLIAEGDFLTAVGEVTMDDANGKPALYSYCDVWHFREGKIAGLKAFVIQTGSH